MSKTKTSAALLLSVLITQLRVVPSKSNTNMKRAIEALSSSSSSEEIGVAVFNTHEPTRYSWNPHPNSVHVIPLTSPEGKHELLQLERRPQVRKMYSDTLVAGILDATYESGNHGKSKEPSKLLVRVTSPSPTPPMTSTSANPNLKASVQEINFQKSKDSYTTHTTQKTTLLAPSAGSFFVNLLVITPAISEFPSLVRSTENQSVSAESHATLLHNRLDHAQQPNNSKKGSLLTFEQVSLATASEPPTSKGQLKELKTEYDDPSEKTDDDSAQLLSSEESDENETINLSLPEPLPVDSSNSAETATGRPLALETDSQNLKELKKNLNAAKSVGSFPTSDELAINQTQLNLSLSIIPLPNPVDGYNSQQTQDSEENSTSRPKYKQPYPREQLQGRSIVPFKHQATNGSLRVENIENQMKLKNERNQFDVSPKHSDETEHLKVNKKKLDEGQGTLENLEQSNQRTAKISGRRVALSGRGVTPAGRSVARAGKQTVQDQTKLITDLDPTVPPADKPKSSKKFASLKNSLDSRIKPIDDGFKNGKENSQSNSGNHIPRNDPVQLSSEGGQTEHLTVDEHGEIEGQGALANLDQSYQRTAKISGRRVAPSGRGLTPAGRSVTRAGKQTVRDQNKFITDSDSSIPLADKPKYEEKFTPMKSSLDNGSAQTDDGFKYGKENSQSNYSKHIPRNEPVQLSSEGGQTEHLTVDKHEEIESQGALENLDQSNQRTGKFSGRRVAPSGRGLTPAGRSVTRAGKQTVRDQIKLVTDSDSSIPPADKPKYEEKFNSLKHSLDSGTKQTDDGLKNGKENSQSNYSKHVPRNEPVQLTSEDGQTEDLTVDEHEQIEGQGATGNPDQSGQRTAKINGRRVAPSGRGLTPAGRSVTRAGKQTVRDQIKLVTDSDSSILPADKPKYPKKFTSLKNSLDSRTKQTDDGFKNGQENSQSSYGKQIPSDEPVQFSSEVGQTEHLTVDEHDEIQAQGALENLDQSEQRIAKINGRRVVPSGRGVSPHVSPHRTTTEPLKNFDISTLVVKGVNEDPMPFEKLSSFSTSKAIANSGTVSSETLLVPQDHEGLKNKYFNETLHSKGNEKDSMVSEQTNQQENLTFNENVYEGPTTEVHALAGAFNLTTTEPTAFVPAPVALDTTQQAFALNRSNSTLLPTSTKTPRKHSSSFGRSVKGLLHSLRSALNVPASSLLHSTEATEPTTINQPVAATQNKSVTVHIKATDGTHAILRANFTSFSAKNSSNNETKRKVMPNVSPESLANLSFAIQDLVQAIKKHNFHHKKHGSSHSKDPGIPKRPETVQNPTNISTSQKDKVPGSPEAVLIHIRAPDGTTFDLQANSSSSLWKEFQEMVKVVKYWHENQHDMNQKTNETDAHPLLLQPEQVEPSLADLMPVNVGVNQVGQTFVLDMNSEHQVPTPKAIAQNNELNATKKDNFIVRPTNTQRKAKHHRRKLKSYKRLHKKFKKDPLLLPAIEFALQDAIRRYQRSKGHSSKVSESIEYYDEQLERPDSMELYDETKQPAGTLNANNPVTSDFSQKKPKVHQKLHNPRRLKNQRNQFGVSPKHSGQTEHLKVEEQESNEGQRTLENLDQSNQRTGKFSGRRVAPSGRGLTPAGRSLTRAGKQTAQDQNKFITDSDSSIPPADKPKYSKKSTLSKNSLDSRRKQTDDGFKNSKENSHSNNGKHLPRYEPVQLSSEGTRRAGRLEKLHAGALKKGKPTGGMRGRSMFPFKSKSSTKNLDLDNKNQDSENVINHGGIVNEKSFQEIKTLDFPYPRTSSPLIKMDDESLVYKETFNHHKPDILPTTITKYPVLMNGMHVNIATRPTTRIPSVKPSKKFVPMSRKAQALGRAATGTPSQGQSARQDPEKFTLHDILIRAFKSGRIKP